MAKYKFHPELLKYLDLKDKLYTIDNIKAVLLVKSKLNSDKTHNNYINLDKEGYELFFNTTPAIIPAVQLKALLSLIQTNFVIHNNKPNCEYYEYLQKPIDVLTMRF